MAQLNTSSEELREIQKRQYYPKEIRTIRAFLLCAGCRMPWPQAADEVIASLSNLRLKARVYSG